MTPKSYAEENEYFKGGNSTEKVYYSNCYTYFYSGEIKNKRRQNFRKITIILMKKRKRILWWCLLSGWLKLSAENFGTGKTRPLFCPKKL